MENVIDFFENYIGIIFFALFALLGAAVAIRSAIKLKKGKKVDITPVGVYNDLPGSVTGLNKYKEHKQ